MLRCLTTRKGMLTRMSSTCVRPKVSRQVASRTYTTSADTTAGSTRVLEWLLVFGATAVTGGLAVSVAIIERSMLDQWATSLSTSQTETVTPCQVRVIPYAELQKHATRESCWIMVRDKIYDVTNFLDMHPGGANIILAHAGKDATAIYESLHASAFLDTLLKPEQHLGVVDSTTVPVVEMTQTEDKERVERARREMPALEVLLSVDDFEQVAHKVLSKVAWSYCMSAADTSSAFKGNIDALSRYWFRPRVLRPVRDIDMSTTILGVQSALPIFVSPAAQARLGHPLGEFGITRGAGATGIIQGVASAASCTMEELSAVRSDRQVLFFQLYMNKDRKVSEEMLRKAEALGFKAVFLTVDTPVPGKREMDLKTRGLPTVGGASSARKKGSSLTQAGIASSLGDYFDANLSWDDLVWIKSITKLPIILKGVQRVEDVERAVEHGCAAVLLSNHGGRQLDYAPAPIDVLWELRQRRPDILDQKKIEVYCDSGFRRGTDVLKALCLGATAVGLGRPFWYANGAYGEDGVIKLVDIMAQEIATGMRLLGVTKLSELKPEMVKRMS